MIGAREMGVDKVRRIFIWGEGNQGVGERRERNLFTGIVSKDFSAGSIANYSIKKAQI
jgi:hypothetical protein